MGQDHGHAEGTCHLTQLLAGQPFPKHFLDARRSREREGWKPTVALQGQPKGKPSLVEHGLLSLSRFLPPR